MENLTWQKKKTEKDMKLLTFCLFFFPPKGNASSLSPSFLL